MIETKLRAKNCFRGQLLIRLWLIILCMNCKKELRNLRLPKDNRLLLLLLLLLFLAHQILRIPAFSFSFRFKNAAIKFEQRGYISASECVGLKSN